MPCSILEIWIQVGKSTKKVGEQETLYIAILRMKVQPKLQMCLQSNNRIKIGIVRIDIAFGRDINRRLQCCASLDSQIVGVSLKSKRLSMKTCFGFGESGIRKFMQNIKDLVVIDS